MVDLNADIIKVITNVQAVLIGSPFEVNHFEVGSSGAGGEVIQIDIRRHKKDNVISESDASCVEGES